MKKVLLYTGIVFLVCVFVGLILSNWRLNKANSFLQSELSKEREEKAIPRTYLQGNFVYSTKEPSVLNGENNYFESKKELISESADFIDVNLSTMKITLFQEGKEKEIFPVLTKGREGSWWETPTGRYKTLSFSPNHFSSIGKVWMPWSIQFYGNFFIHGWPYHIDGTPVEKTYSGGCIRLGTEDAKKVYEFTKKNMPILIYEEEPSHFIKPIVPLTTTPINPPIISGEAAIVADIDTGDVLLNKNGDMPFPIASLTKLMTAVVGSELIYLERGTIITSAMMQDEIQSYPLQRGKEYKAFDLFYPLLMESSNGAARALASFLGEKEFIKQMNEKAKTLGMQNAVFVDTSGINEENKSSLKEFARLIKYIADKRFFIFDVTKGKTLSIFSEGELSKIKNFNEFAEDPRLIGMKNGKTSIAKETIASVWFLKTPDGEGHRIFIGVLKSDDRKKDTELILNWLNQVFDLK